MRTALVDAACYASGNGTLVVNMSQTQFCDSSGVNVLVRAYQRAQAKGGEVLLVVSATAILRLLALTGADRLIPHFASLDQALGQPGAPAGADHLTKTLVC